MAEFKEITGLTIGDLDCLKDTVSVEVNGSQYTRKVGMLASIARFLGIRWGYGLARVE